MKSTAPKQPYKTVAIVTIHDVPKMTKARRKRIAAWLRSGAYDMEEFGYAYKEGRFTVHYYAKE